MLSSSQKPKDTKPYDRERLWAKKKMKEQQQRLEKNEKVKDACKHSRQLHLCITNIANPFIVVKHEIAVASFENDTKQCQSIHPPFSTTLKLPKASTDVFPYLSRLPPLYRRHPLHILPHPHPNRHSQESEPVPPAKGASWFLPPQCQHQPLPRASLLLPKAPPPSLSPPRR